MATAELLAGLPDALVSIPPYVDPYGDHEVVNGQVVETLPMGVWECYVASKIFGQFFVKFQGLEVGRPVTETLFILRRDPLLRRKPDVAFISAARWPMDRPIPRGEAAWDVVPDLVVEVVSPTDLAANLHGKITEYRSAGVRQTWVVFPEQTEVVEYLADRTSRTYGPGETIPGGDLLPGFTLSINEVFELN